MRSVPHISLLWLTALLIVPACAAAVALEGVESQIAVLVILLVLVFATVDLALSHRCLANLSVESPELLRCTKGREVVLPLVFLNRGSLLKNVRYGVEIRSEFRCVGPRILFLESLPTVTRQTTVYPLIPLRQGQFRLGPIQAETRSRMGLWMIRSSFPIPVEVRVYPDLSTERRRLAAIFLMRGNDGMRLMRQLGKGREFEQLRDYQLGDDYADVDWKATARRRHPVTRTYQIERTQEIYVVVDHSRLSAREIRVPADEVSDLRTLEESQGGEEFVTTQLEKFLHCALVLAGVAERQGDLFGFISFADREDRFLRAGRGKGHYNLVRDALYTLEPRAVAPDYGQIMSALRMRLSRRALLVVLTDLTDPLGAEQFFEALPLVSRQHLVLVNMVRPEDAWPIFSPKNMPDSDADIYTRLAGHYQWADLREIGRQLRRLGATLTLPDQEQLCAEVVSQYLSAKQRQIL